ncbi:hypothetical protein PM082_006566 [Marasmius tenuissimus]|nr:hypothetical protein PM082_006566 [Marasmius tenuissimus]
MKHAIRIPVFPTSHVITVRNNITVTSRPPRYHIRLHRLSLEHHKLQTGAITPKHPCNTRVVPTHIISLASAYLVFGSLNQRRGLEKIQRSRTIPVIVPLGGKVPAEVSQPTEPLESQSVLSALVRPDNHAGKSKPYEVREQLHDSFE